MHSQLILVGKERTETFVLNQDMVTIGSQPDCHVVIRDDSVAPRHATIMHGRNSIRLCTLQSEKPTLVDGQSGNEFELKSASLIELGKVRLIFQLQVGEEQGAPAPPRKRGCTKVAGVFLLLLGALIGGAILLNSGSSPQTGTSATTATGTSQPSQSAESPQEKEEINFEDFNNAKMMRALYEQDLKFLNASRDAHLYRVGAMMGFFNQHAPLLGNSSLATRAVLEAQRSTLGGGDLPSQGVKALEIVIGQLSQPERILSDAMNVEALVTDAQQDALRLIRRYGEDGEVSKQVMKGIKVFVESSRNEAKAPDQIRLHESKVEPFGRGHVGSIYSLPQHQQDKASDHIYEIQQSGQQVIRCAYGPSDPVKGTGFRTYYFWYEKVPAQLEEMLREIPAHPVKVLGTKAIRFDEVPQTYEEAQAFRRSASYD